MPPVFNPLGLSRVLPLPDGDGDGDDGSINDGFDRHTRSTSSTWGTDKILTYKPLLPRLAETPTVRTRVVSRSSVRWPASGRHPFVGTRRTNNTPDASANGRSRILVPRPGFTTGDHRWGRSENSVLRPDGRGSSVGIRGVITPSMPSTPPSRRRAYMATRMTSRPPDPGTGAYPEIPEDDPSLAM